MSSHSQVVVLLVMVILGFLSFAAPDAAADRAECTNVLIGLSTCLTYVQGQSAAPTPDCCAGMKHVLDTNRKCLCILIKDSNDPSLGIKMNVTLAVTLPSMCKLESNISHCPVLLNLPPHSKDAEMFEQLGGQKITPSGSVSSDSMGSQVGSSPAKPTSSDGTCNVIIGVKRRWLGVEIVGGSYALIHLVSLIFLFMG